MTRVRLWLRIVFRQAVQARSSWITLALCLGVAVLFTQLYGGFREAERARVLHLFGAQQGLFIDAGNDVLDALRRDARVDRLGEAVVTGLASNPASGQSVTVPLGFLDDTARSLAGVALQEGRWPETESEIAIERITLSTLRLRAGVGDTVVLSVLMSPREDAPDSQPMVEQISFRLVGILDNYSFMQYHPNDPDGKLTGLPSLITAGNPESDKGDAVARFAYVQVAEHTSYVALFNEYADRFDLSLQQYSLNTEAYRPDAPLKSIDGYPQDNLNSWFPHNTETETYQNASKTPRQMLLLVILLLAGLAVLLFLTTLQMLYKKQADSAFRLRLAGVSPSQLTVAAVLQATMALVILLPAGALLGGLGALAADRWYLRARIPYFQVRVDPAWMLATVAAFSLLLIWRVAFTWRAFRLYRPLDASAGRLPDQPNRSARKREEPKSFPRDSSVPDARERHPILFWARRSFQENRAALSGVVFLLGLGLAVLLISSYVIAVLQMDNSYNSRYDVELSMGNSGTLSILNIPVREPGFAREDLTDLTRLDEFRICRLESQYRVNLVGDRTEESDRLLSSMFQFLDSENQGIPLAGVLEDKKRYGYLDSEKLYLGNVTGVEPDVLETMRADLLAGDIDIPALSEGRQVLLLTGSSDPVAKVGDSLVLTQVINPDDTNTPYEPVVSHGVDTSSWERRDVQVTIGGIVRFPDRGSDAPVNMTRELLGEEAMIVWGLDAFRLFGLEDRIQSVYIQMKDYRDDEKLRAAVQELDILYPYMTTLMRSEAEQQTQIGNNIVLSVIYLLLFLLALFSVFVIRSISLSLATRNRRLIGALRAGGFSWDRMRRLKALESFVLVVSAALSAHVIGIGVAIPMLVNSNRIAVSTGNQILDLFRYYPLVPMLIILPALLALVYFFQMSPIRRLYKQPVCELIREE